MEAVVKRFFVGIKSAIMDKSGLSFNSSASCGYSIGIMIASVFKVFMFVLIVAAAMNLYESTEAVLTWVLK